MIYLVINTNVWDEGHYKDVMCATDNEEYAIYQLKQDEEYVMQVWLNGKMLFDIGTDKHEGYKQYDTDIKLDDFTYPVYRRVVQQVKEQLVISGRT